jgi:hypothetical protein
MHRPGYVQGGQEASFGYLLLGIYYRRIPGDTAINIFLLVNAKWDWLIMRAACSLSLCPSFLLDSSLLPIGCWNLQIVRQRQRQIGQCNAMPHTVRHLQ